jgi:hypothetical protein
MRNFMMVLSVTTAFATPLKAQVEVLPPDFTLSGKTSGDYCAEYHQITFTISTNESYLFPEAGPFSEEGVYYLHRPTFYFPTLGIQTYFVPDNVYVFLPIIVQSWDDVDSYPYTAEELRDILRADLDDISGVRLNIDGVLLVNPLAYRTESPIYSVYFPTPDNIYSFILARPFEGLVDPQVAGGYVVMLKPLPQGLHDVHTAYTFGEPNGFTRERHYQIYSLSPPAFLAHQMEPLEAAVSSSGLAPGRRAALIGSLDAAKTSFASNSLRAGINQLHAFQNKVRAQVESSNALLATQFSESAQRLMDRAATQLKNP